MGLSNLAWLTCKQCCLIYQTIGSLIDHLHWLLIAVKFMSQSPSNVGPTHIQQCRTELGQWTRSALVQVMACRLFCTKPLPEPMLAFCQLDSWEQISVKFESEFYHFHSRKCIWKCCLPEWQPFCPGGDEFLEILKSYPKPSKRPHI